MSSDDKDASVTSTKRLLSTNEVAQYRRDGYLLVTADRLFADASELAAFLEWSIAVCSWPEVKGKWMQYFEKSLVDGRRMLNRVEKFLDFHPQLNAAFRTGVFAQLVAEAAGEPVVLFKEKINYKLPGGDGFKPHQDVQAGWDRYGHSIHINALIAIDACTVANGCLELARGRHKEGLLGPQWQELPADVVDALHFEPAELCPGDVVLFDSFVPHRSAPNLTDQSRRAMYITYNLAAEGDYRETYFADKRQSFPPDIERLPGVDYQYKI